MSMKELLVVLLGALVIMALILGAVVQHFAPVVVEPVFATGYHVADDVHQAHTESAMQSEVVPTVTEHCFVMGGFNAEIISCPAEKSPRSHMHAVRTLVSKDKPKDSPTVVVVDDDLPNLPDAPDVPDVPAEKDKGNNGNHYGNDKQPDNNNRDNKNKHDGCDANCTGNDNDKAKDKPKKEK